MRISDWSSDVCSSDLVDLSLIFSSEGTADAGAFVSMAESLFCLNAEERAALEASTGGFMDAEGFSIDAMECVADKVESGRASCRERVCQYVLFSVFAGSLK